MAHGADGWTSTLITWPDAKETRAPLPITINGRRGHPHDVDPAVVAAADRPGHAVRCQRHGRQLHRHRRLLQPRRRLTRIDPPARRRVRSRLTRVRIPPPGEPPFGVWSRWRSVRWSGGAGEVGEEGEGAVVVAGPFGLVGADPEGHGRQIGDAGGGVGPQPRRRPAPRCRRRRPRPVIRSRPGRGPGRRSGCRGSRRSGPRPRRGPPHGWRTPRPGSPPITRGTGRPTPSAAAVRRGTTWVSMAFSSHIQVMVPSARSPASFSMSGASAAR